MRADEAVVRVPLPDHDDLPVPPAGPFLLRGTQGDLPLGIRVDRAAGGLLQLPHHRPEVVRSLG
ncbi:hypothetical protein [Streptomyces mirabilis]|uniref:hypothetical protein n=1 Tax=Streptomyces mirabilis TaxID=68239 RepID=UPI0036658F95